MSRKTTERLMFDSESKQARQRRKRHPYLLILPSVIFMTLVILVPLVRGLVMSFTEVDLTKQPPEMIFVGLYQFQRLIGDTLFWSGLKNTIEWTIGIVTFQYLFGLGIALLLNERIPCRGVFRALVLVPWVVPSVVAAFIWRWIYAGDYGILNYIFQQLGLIDRPIHWLANPNVAMGAVIAVGVWRWTPFMAVVLLSGLQSIPKELYDAAEVDGANIAQQFWYITLPGLRYLSMIVTMLSIIWTFNHFDIVYVMTRGGPANATHLISTYAYLTAFSFFDFGYAAAMSVVMLLFLLIFTIIYTRILSEDEKL